MKLKKYLLIGLFIWTRAILAQDIALTVSGQVIDAATNRPLFKAHAYYSGTTIVANTDSLGRFSLNRKLTPGKYTLVFSHVGYEPKIAKITVSKTDSLNFNVLLVPQELELPEVMISATKDVVWQKNYTKFKEEFLGSSELAKTCRIQNPWILEFQTKHKQLLASAKGELIIENQWLGYKIYCNLVSFTNTGFQTNYLGFYRFDKMKPSGKKQQRKWQKRRENAFYGSFRHFVYALLHQRVAAEGFDVLRSKESPAKTSKPRMKYVKTRKLFVRNEKGNFLINKGYLKVSYLKSTENLHYIRYIVKQSKGYQAFKYKGKPLSKNAFVDLNDKDLKLNFTGNKIYYRRKRHTPTSWIYLKNDQLKVSNFGIVLDKPTNLKTFGYWAWQRVGDMLPFDFVPKQILKRLN